MRILEIKYKMGSVEVLFRCFKKEKMQMFSAKGGLIIVWIYPLNALKLKIFQGSAPYPIEGAYSALPPSPPAAKGKWMT